MSRLGLVRGLSTMAAIGCRMTNPAFDIREIDTQTEGTDDNLCG